MDETILLIRTRIFYLSLFILVHTILSLYSSQSVSTQISLKIAAVAAAIQNTRLASISVLLFINFFFF